MTTTKLEKTQTAIARIDAAVGKSLDLFGNATSLSQALMLAQAIGEIETHLTSDMLKQLTRFQDSSLGFRTDRDPCQVNRKTGKPFDPYPERVVKRCLIESLLRGLQVCGNQFNIISGNSYTTKNGYLYLIKHRVPGQKGYKETLGIPKMSDGGAIVSVSASWTLNEDEDSIVCDLPIKVNAMMGVDAILGKAERKLRKRAYEQMTGNSTVDGDADEQPEVYTSAQVGDAPKQIDNTTPEKKPTKQTPVFRLSRFYEDEIKGHRDIQFYNWLIEMEYIKMGSSIRSMKDDKIEELLDPKLVPSLIKQFGPEEVTDGKVEVVKDDKEMEA
jgi:hypothetical protein